MYKHNDKTNNQNIAFALLQKSERLSIAKEYLTTFAIYW